MEKEFQFNYQNMSNILDLLTKIKDNIVNCKDELSMMFKMGVVIHSYDKSYDFNTLASFLNINQSDLNYLITAVEDFEFNLDKFLDYAEKNNIKNWSDYIHHYIINSSNAKGNVDIEDIANDIKYALKKYLNEKNENDYTYFIQLRDLLLKYFPLTSEVFDTNYLRYSLCVVCDAEPPIEGHEIILDPEYPHMKIPICRSCLELNEKIDYKKVASFYCLYAINTEVAYYNITLK